MPSPKSEIGSAGRSRRAPRPEYSAASASAMPSPPSETSCASVHRGGHVDDEANQRRLSSEIEWGRRSRDSPVACLQLGAGQGRRSRRGKEDAITRLPSSGNTAHVRDEANAADHGRRRDRAAVGVVVERHVPGDDRQSQRFARLRHPFDRLGKLPADLGLFGVAEVETIGETERIASCTGDVTGIKFKY